MYLARQFNRGDGNSRQWDICVICDCIAVIACFNLVEAGAASHHSGLEYAVSALLCSLMAVRRRTWVGVGVKGTGGPLMIVVAGPDRPMQTYTAARRPEQSLPTAGFQL